MFFTKNKMFSFFLIYVIIFRNAIMSYSNSDLVGLAASIVFCVPIVQRYKDLQIRALIVDNASEDALRQEMVKHSKSDTFIESVILISKMVGDAGRIAAFDGSVLQCLDYNDKSPAGRFFEDIFPNKKLQFCGIIGFCLWKYFKTSS